jgi:hypothetical protein
LSSYALLQTHERQVICVIDGDGTIFSRDLVKTGREGGLAAIRLLTDAINDYLPGEPMYHLWIYCFMNKRGLARPLGVMDTTLDDFIAGFNQADGRAFLVDIGYGKEVADARIRGMNATLDSVTLTDISVRPDLITLNASSPRTLKIFFGGQQLVLSSPGFFDNC